MSNHDEDLKLVAKGAVKDVLIKIRKLQYAGLESDPLVVTFSGAIEAINKLPCLTARKARPDEEIERAIESLEKCYAKMKTMNYPWGSYWDFRCLINLLKWVSNQPQGEKGYPGSTWSDEELLGEEGQNEKTKEG